MKETTGRTITRKSQLRCNRRAAIAGTAAAVVATALRRSSAARAPVRMGFGLVTYMWGADWRLPQLLEACEKAEVWGVELRTTHAHGVEPSLGERERAAVRRRFEQSRVELVGLGSNERFDHPDPADLKKAIEATKRFVELSHDVGGSGVKVKPNQFHKGVPREKTIRQIGESLNLLGEFASGFGQQIRLEVHGQCAEIPVMAAIMKVADHPNVAICWNSNAQDLKPPGLEANFKTLRPRFGQTLHVRELDNRKYPFAQLLKLLIDSDYAGWVMLEGRDFPKATPKRIAALARQRQLFDQMTRSHS